MKFLIALTLLLCWTLTEANSPAQLCPGAACQLPDCKCSTTKVPDVVNDITEYPQIVMLSYDDDVGTYVYDNYFKPLLDITNPDGCPIGLTFYLSHDYTDYTLVNDLWKRGHEIASHSITHQTPTDYWKNLDYNGWIDEMYGQRQIASYLANIPIDDIKGARSPFLQGNGDVMIQALSDSGFEYDTTYPTQKYMDPPLYSYTYDYKTTQECEIPPCPVDSFPGFWEVPLVDFNCTNGYPSSMLDSCTVYGLENTFDFLVQNFNKHYYSNRAPIGLFTHASWFETEKSHFPAYEQFIHYVLTLPDVYIVTVSKMLEWLKSPTKLVDLPSFEPWKCPKLQAPCTPRSCYYPTTTPGNERYMDCCNACPPNYPWLGDPFGNKTVSQNSQK